MVGSLNRNHNLCSRRDRSRSQGSGARRHSVGGRLWYVRIVLFSLSAIVSLAATAAVAQDANYSSVEATADKPVQLSYHASANKKNCAPGALPTIRVIDAPKAGLLTVRKAVLTTDKIEGCPGLKTPVQVVFYAARSGYVGPDRVKYEVTSENGEVSTFETAITIKAALPQSPPAGDKAGRPL